MRLITKAVVIHTKKTMFFTFITSILLGAIGMGIGNPELAASFSARTDPIVERMDAFLEARGDNTETEGVDEERSQGFGNIHVYFESKSGDVFSQANLESIAKAQQKFVGFSGLEDYCQLNYADDGSTECLNPDSPLQVLTDGTVDGCVPQCSYDSVPECQMTDALYASHDADIASDTNVRARLYELCGAEESSAEDFCEFLLYAYQVSIMSTDATCVSATDVAATYTRFSYSLGGPLAGFDNNADSTNEQWDRIVEGLAEDVDIVAKLFDLFDEIEGENSDLELHFYSLWVDSTEYYLARDMMFVILSIILVYLVLHIQTQSLFLALCGLYEILISFPVTYFFFCIMAQQQRITVLAYLSLFIILAVGGDDCFVLIDAWKQSALQPPEISGSLETRFEWAYSRAARAMLITTLTTFVAFVSLSFSSIWDISCFGAFTGTIVLVDYILAITWLPACVIFYERHLRAKCAHKLCGCCVCPKICPPPPGAEAEKPEMRPLEVFFQSKFTDGVVRFRLFLSVFLILLLVGTTVAWTIALSPATKEPTFFDEDHPYSVAQSIHQDEFQASTDELKVSTYFVYGIDSDEAIDRDGSHPADRNYLGIPQFNGIDLSSAAAQEDLIAVCQEVLVDAIDDGLAPTADGSYCFMEDFKLWRENNGEEFPFQGTETELIDALALWKDAEDMYGGANRSAFIPNYHDSTGYGVNADGTAMTFAFVGFNSTLDFSNSVTFDKMDTAYKGWQALMDEQNGKRSITGYQTNFFWGWYATSSELTSSAYKNIIISLALATAVLLVSTQNWVLVALALVCMYTILSLCFSLLAAAGWEVNVLESISISVATGLSVDYVVHVVLAYNESENTDRVGRLRDSLTTMGVSVLSGALTTIFACSSLFGCDLLWFFQFGTFVVVLCSSAIFVTLTFLTGVLALLGPEGEFGSFARYLQRDGAQGKTGKTEPVHQPVPQVEMSGTA